MKKLSILAAFLVLPLMTWGSPQTDREPGDAPAVVVGVQGHPSGLAVPVSISTGAVTVSGPVDQGAQGVGAAAGSWFSQGPVANGATAAGNPFVIAIVDDSGFAVSVPGDAAGVPAILADSTVAADGLTTSSTARFVKNDGGSAAGQVVLHVFNGTNFYLLRGTIADGLTVNLAGNNDVTVTGNVNLTAPVTVQRILEGVTIVAPIPAGTNNMGDVDVLSSALPTGASTSALQTTGNTSIDQIDAGVTVLTGTVSGSEQQVDIVASIPAGTNNIGDVDVLTLPALVAGTALVGTVASGDRTDVIFNGTTALTPKYLVVDDALSGDNTLQAAVPGNKIRILSCFMIAAGNVNVRFEDGAAGTALTGQMNLTKNSGFTIPYNPAGWFETSVNTLLNLELSAAISVDGSCVYVEVP